MTKIDLKTKLTIICLLGLVFPSPVRAAHEPPEAALTVSPAIAELVVEPGKTSNSVIKVINVTDFALPIKVSVENTLVDAKIINQAQDLFNSSSWIKVDQADFILQAYETKMVSFSIDVPEGVEPGGHYATIYFQPLLPQGLVSGQANFLTARVGVLSFMIVPGEVIERADIVGLTAQSSEQPGAKEITLTLKNTGNVHLLPSGKITIKDILGREVDRIDLPPTVVLPQTEKQIKVVWSKQLGLGQYHAQASIEYGTKHQPLTSETIDFWFLPWTVLALTAVILFLVKCLLKLLRHARLSFLPSSQRGNSQL